MKTIFAPALIALACVMPALAKKAKPAALATIGKTAPGFTVLDSKGRTRDLADFKGKVKSSLHSLQRNTKKIRSFFEKDTLRYAA
jgi:hypothetical protein